MYALKPVRLRELKKQAAFLLKELESIPVLTSNRLSDFWHSQLHQQKFPMDH